MSAILKEDITSSNNTKNIEKNDNNLTQQKQNNSKKNNLLGILVKKGILTKDQIKVAKTQANKTGDSIIDVLIQLNFITDSVIHNIFEKHQDTKNKINLIEMVPDMELIKKIPTQFAIDYKVLPISASDEKIIIATSNPYNVVLMDQISALFDGKEIEAIPYTEAELIAAVDKFYNGNVIADLSSILTELEINVNNVKKEDVNTKNTPIVKFIDALLYEAIKCNASDIHIEPDEMFVRIRMRIDGILVNKTIVHKNYWSGICVRIKVLSGMNIAEQHRPQDGAMSMTIQGREIDFRVSAIPTIYGENIVIRILDKTHSLTKLGDLGFNKHNLKLINLALKKPEGIIIITGPTGSGKTTTLYSLLSIINNVGDNIMTLEEPVEYRMPLIRQSEINHRAGFDFSSGLRSLLRQDPDIIFLGEIRDKETAEIAVRSAITGHQVFSTLHTNGALSTITRLIDIGIQPYMLSDCLTAIIAQRLARRLCRYCKKEKLMSQKMKKVFELNQEKEYKICFPVGCEKCNQTGFKGRIAVSEVLMMDQNLKDTVTSNPTIKSITDVAKKSGFISMQRDAILKIAKGITSFEEIQRVVDMTEYSRYLDEEH